MEFAKNDQAAQCTEQIMQAIDAAGVLRVDEMGYPQHYNRAFEVVYDSVSRFLSRPVAMPRHRWDFAGPFSTVDR